MIFYEAPHKLPNTLRDLYKTFGNRRLTIARELTKVHEQIIRTTTETGRKDEERSAVSLEEAVAFANRLIEGGMRPTDAAKEAAAMAGLKKNDIYKELI